MPSIVLAEPSAPVAGALRRYLESAGHAVSWVGSVDEALRTVREQSPAILLASGTGALDGEALCRSVRAEGLAAPVLLLYAPEEEHADTRAADAGADGCLVGPLKRATVLTCVSLLVQREDARRRVAALKALPPPMPVVPPPPPPLDDEDATDGAPPLPGAGEAAGLLPGMVGARDASVPPPLPGTVVAREAAVPPPLPGTVDAAVPPPLPGAAGALAFAIPPLPPSEDDVGAQPSAVLPPLPRSDDAPVGVERAAASAERMSEAGPLAPELDAEPITSPSSEADGEEQAAAMMPPLAVPGAGDSEEDDLPLLHAEPEPDEPPVATGVLVDDGPAVPPASLPGDGAEASGLAQSAESTTAEGARLPSSATLETAGGVSEAQASQAASPLESQATADATGAAPASASAAQASQAASSPESQATSDAASAVSGGPAEAHASLATPTADSEAPTGGTSAAHASRGAALPGSGQTEPATPSSASSPGGTTESAAASQAVASTSGTPVAASTDSGSAGGAPTPAAGSRLSGSFPALAPAPDGRRISRSDLASVGAHPDFEFLKRLMLMEVKRSRRYRYPIAVLLVDIDRFAEKAAALPPAARKLALAEALGLLVSGVRDIDVAVPFADSRFVVFLPHTPRSGALVVGQRLRELIKSLKAFEGASASVGVAVSEPTAGRGPVTGAFAQVSFGSLLKEAGEALRRAQAAGGDWVEAASGRTQPG
ncbi:diguanylate cyclase [Myxococcus sp. Y35]|uniref:diguanylate cyclase n=1 Tax=Pseudomyxococcus flavus TaxID=3115648 RepID=UPI003CF0B4BB